MSRIPYFENDWVDAPKDNKETIKRKNVFALVEHPEWDKYMLLDWEKFWWKSFVVWWVEWDENYEEAAIRETIEETGYNDIKSTEIIAWDFHNNFYAAHKWVNRYSVEKYVLVKLNSLKSVPVDEKETKNHKAIWINKKKVQDFLNLDNNLYAWQLFLKNKKEDLEYLESLNNFRKFI